MAKEKLIIYREMDGLKVTPESNFNARIRDERRVTNCSAFSNAEEVREYFCQYFGCKDEEEAERKAEEVFKMLESLEVTIEEE